MTENDDYYTRYAWYNTETSALIQFGDYHSGFDGVEHSKDDAKKFVTDLVDSPNADLADSNNWVLLKLTLTGNYAWELLEDDHEFTYSATTDEEQETRFGWYDGHDSVFIQEGDPHTGFDGVFESVEGATTYLKTHVEKNSLDLEDVDEYVFVEIEVLDTYANEVLPEQQL